MRYYLAIDGGTTNTRVTLTRGDEPLDTVRVPIGARASIDDTAPLKTAIREAIDTLLCRHALSVCDVHRILASGMITSEFGLCTLPHLPAPAGMAELHGAMHETAIPEISPIPFVFLRGVKYDGDTPLDADMMRGEETELMGILEKDAPAALYVLPGSHSKLIEVDGDGRIRAFRTMMTGEMIAALAQNTILRDAVDLRVGECERESLCEGYRCAREAGINQALFRVRILKKRFSYSPEKTYSFFLGAILQAEIDAIIASPCHRVTVGGKAQIKRATVMLLETFSDKELVTVSDACADNAAARGMVRIYEYQ